MLLEKRGH
ncbi:hypothetical protein SPV_2560 [Streptococcus pneumoniae]|nr:hypothetical protein SPV_2560 [Streptococcus pneumoniae]